MANIAPPMVKLRLWRVTTLKTNLGTKYLFIALSFDILVVLLHLGTVKIDNIDACCRCQDLYVISHLVLQLLLWPLTLWQASGLGNPVAEPDHTWDHSQKAMRPHSGHFGSLSRCMVDVTSL
jgi:hypothetical protein